MTEADFQAHVARLQALQARHGARHEAAAVAEARRLGATLASHDDTTAAQVAASAGHGARVAEFPTTLEAARACRAHGIAVIAGAPNLIRGGSHSGNVPPQALADAGLLDILSSDYAPASLLAAAVRLGLAAGDLAAGLATVTAAPARATGLADRGRLAPGLAADLLRFRLDGDLAIPRGVWVGGAARRLTPLLSYQHAYHAGGPADLHKHIVLAELLARLTAQAPRHHLRRDPRRPRPLRPRRPRGAEDRRSRRRASPASPPTPPPPSAAPSPPSAPPPAPPPTPARRSSPAACCAPRTACSSPSCTPPSTPPCAPPSPAPASPSTAATASRPCSPSPRSSPAAASSSSTPPTS